MFLPKFTLAIKVFVILILATSTVNSIRGGAIMLVKLSIILFSNSHNFTDYSQNDA